MPFDPLKDFAPITVLGRGAHVIVAHPSLPVQHRSQELIDYASRTRASCSYASPGHRQPAEPVGRADQEQRPASTSTHVPYKGGGQAIADVVSGQIQLGVLGMAPALPHIKAGRLEALRGDRRRSARRSLPDVPTVAEAGVPGFETVQWLGPALPPARRPPVIKRLHDELVQAS